MQSRLKPTLLLLTMIIGAQCFAQSDLSARDRFLYLRYSKMERNSCLRLEKHGYSAGQRHYRQTFRSCTDFLLAGGSFDTFFTPQAPNLSREEQCYDSGYRYGYVQESVKQWSPCADQYIEALVKSNADLVEQCKKMSMSAVASAEKFSEDLQGALEASDDPQIIEDFARIIYVAELGYGYKVWDKVLELTAIPKVDKLACSIVLSKNLLGEAL
ncbi:MAG: hypothetical protein ACOVS5_11265 [Oligoflexus sp.]|jgi:hypothetical protein